MDVDTLESMLKGDPGLFAKFKKAMKYTPDRVSRKKEHDGPTIIYTKVIKVSTCIHCGTRQETVYSLGKGDSIPYIKDGIAKSIFVIKPKEDPIIIKADVATCYGCERYMKALSREEIEGAYMKLLYISACRRIGMGRT